MAALSELGKREGRMAPIPDNTSKPSFSTSPKAEHDTLLALSSYFQSRAVLVPGMM